MKYTCKVYSFWHGRPWTKLEQMCALSYVRYGYVHSVYAYHPLENVPEEIKVLDAREIWDIDPGSIKLHNKYNSVAPFSDLFRYKVCAKHDGAIVVGSDQVLIRPLPDTEYLIGVFEVDLIGDALLKIPSKSELMRTIIKLSKELEDDYCDFPWCSTGPLLLQEAVQMSESWSYLLPEKAFYPLSPIMKMAPFVNNWNKFKYVLEDPEIYSLQFYATGAKSQGADFDNPVPGSLYAKLVERYL
jgi:hypothetical protein